MLRLQFFNKIMGTNLLKQQPKQTNALSELQTYQVHTEPSLERATENWEPQVTDMIWKSVKLSTSNGTLLPSLPPLPSFPKSPLPQE